MKLPVLQLIALLLPAIVSAQGYKCKQPDGRLSYQDQPCQAGSTAAKITAAPLPAAPPPARSESPTATSRRASIAARNFEAETQRQRQEQEIKALNDRIDAQNRAIRCDRARENLGTLKLARPVYRFDNKGEKQYVDDTARQAEIAAAQNAVAQNCN